MHFSHVGNENICLGLANTGHRCVRRGGGGSQSPIIYGHTGLHCIESIVLRIEKTQKNFLLIDCFLLRLIGPKGTSQAQHYAGLAQLAELPCTDDPLNRAERQKGKWFESIIRLTFKPQRDMEKYKNPNYELDPELMADMIKTSVFRIDRELEEHEKRMKELMKRKSALQVICEHKFEPDGRTHTRIFEKCTICGFNRGI